MTLKYCSIEKICADVLTKPLQGKAYQEIRMQLMDYPEPYCKNYTRAPDGKMTGFLKEYKVTGVQSTGVHSISIQNTEMQTVNNGKNQTKGDNNSPTSSKLSQSLLEECVGKHQKSVIKGVLTWSDFFDFLSSSFANSM